MPRTKSKIELPTILTKETRFYKGNEELLDPHLNKPYISYSSVESWLTYREDFIKNKFAGIKLPDGIYAALGNYVGQAIETGKFGDNPYGFVGQENLDLKGIRPKGAEYEKIVVIDMGGWLIIGFIDIFYEKDKKATVLDVKTAGKGKEDKFKSEEYIQTTLYCYYVDKVLKIPISYTGIYFIRRSGSHMNLPLKIEEEQFYIPLEYNEDRVKYSLDVVKKAVGEISDYYKVYKKYFC